MRPELILWDWNGTLLDDVELCVDALNRLLEKHAYPQRYDRDQYRAIFGFPMEEYYVRAGCDVSRHRFYYRRKYSCIRLFCRNHISSRDFRCMGSCNDKFRSNCTGSFAPWLFFPCHWRRV